MKRLFVPFVVLVLCVFAGCKDSQTVASRTGSVASDFNLQDIQGHPVRLSDYKGKAVVLEFWATWCEPCRMSIPGIERVHKTYKDKGLVVLGVSLDQGGWDSVRSFVNEMGMTYPVLKGTEEVASQYQVRTIPMILVLDKNHRIAKRYLGAGNDDELEKDVKSFL